MLGLIPILIITPGCQVIYGKEKPLCNSQKHGSYTLTNLEDNSTLEVLGSATANAGVCSCLSQLPESSCTVDVTKRQLFALKKLQSIGVFVTSQ